MSAKYKSPSFLLPNELNTSANTANDTGINSLYSMDFNGSSDYIDVGNPTELQLTGAFSVSLWMKTIATGTGAFVAKDNNASNPRGFSVEFNNSAPGGYFVIYNGTTTYGVYVFSSDANYINIRDNNWHHIVAVYTPSTSVALFVDGNFVKSNTTNIPASVNFVNDNLNIGRRPQSGGVNYYQGKLDEVAIFNRALSTTEIAALYDGSGSNIRPSNLMATNLNPIAYYPLGEQAQMQGYLGNEASSEWQFPNGVLQDYVMDFDGGSVSTLSTYSGLDGANKLTISFWVKSTSAVTSVPLSIGTSPNRQIFVIIQSSNRIVFRKNENGDNTYLRADSGTPHDGNWNHILISMDLTASPRGGIYFNGNNITYQNTLDTNAIQTSTGSLLVGDSANFVGNIAQLAIWSGTDLRNDVATIYNNGSPNDLNNNGLTAPTTWWKLNATSVYTPSAPNYTKALSFNGTNDFIKLNSNTQNFTNFSLSFWCIKGGGHYKSIVGSNTSNEGGILKAIVVASGSIRYSDSTNSWVDISGALSSTTWNHILITYNNTGNSLKTYKNGTLITTKNPDYSGSSTNAHSIRYIGARYNTGFFNKYISNVALFDSELTASQALTLFNFGTPETNISFNPTHWWKLDDQAAIIDYGSGGINGTNNGATDISSGVAVTPSWKIPSALPITSTPNYTTALDFNGSSDYIDTNYSITSGNKTISFWFNSSYAGYQSIMGNTSDSFILGYWSSQFAVPQGISYLQGSTSKAFAITASVTNEFADGNWHHFVYTYDGNSKIYIDGTERTISYKGGTTSSDDIVVVSNLALGLNRAGYPKYSGKLSNTSIWNTALTPSQVSTLFNNGTPETSISFSPISWWKLDTGGSTITDYGSGGNNGTNNGATQVTSDVLTTQPVNGVSTTLPSTALQQSDLQFDSPYSNYSLEFDGANYINCGDSDIFSFGDSANDSPFSVSAWVNITGTTSQGIVSKYATNASFREWLFYTTGGNTRLLLYDVNATANTIATSTTTLSTNTWHHVVCTYNGVGGANANQGINLYIDGAKESVTLAGGNYNAMANTTEPVAIGKHSASNYLIGKMDETAIFNTVLSEAQVLEIYNNGRPNDLTTFSGTAPISWWRLGENAYFQDSTLVLPNSIVGAPNGEASTNNLEMISADAPGTYANGVGSDLDILDRVGDAPLSTSNSQSYNMIPSDISPYVPQYVGNQIANNFSMNFDGTNYFTASSKFDFIQQTGIFSISTWIKMSDNTSATNQVIAGTNYTGSNVGWQLWIDNRSSQSPAVNKTLKFHLWNSSTNLLAIDQVITDNDWNLITITGDGTTIRAYKNGSLLSTTQSISGSTSSIAFSDLRIGANTVSSPSVFFNGQIDEVAIFDKALNAGQIFNDLYQPTATATATNKTADLVNNPNLPNPVAWYRMGD